MKKTLIAVAISASLSSVAFGYQVPECKPNDFKCLNDRLDTIEGSLYYQVDNRLGDNRRDINKIGDALENKFSTTNEVNSNIAKARADVYDSMQDVYLTLDNRTGENSLQIEYLQRQIDDLAVTGGVVSQDQLNSAISGVTQYTNSEIDKLRQVVGLSSALNPDAKPEDRLDRRFDRVVAELNAADWDTIIAGEGGVTQEQAGQMGEAVYHAAAENAAAADASIIQNLSDLQGKVQANSEELMTASGLANNASNQVIALKEELASSDIATNSTTNSNITTAHSDVMTHVNELSAVTSQNLSAMNDHFQNQIDELSATTGGVTIEQAQDLYEYHEGRIDGVNNEIKDVYTYADSIKNDANMASVEAREAQQGVSVVMDSLRSADWERTAGVTDLRAELEAANWDELKGDGQIDMTETNNNITAAHANAVEQAQAMNAQLMAKLEAMQAQIDALQKPTNPEPPVDTAGIQARYEADMKQLAQKIHNDYQGKIAALEDKVNNIKPSVPTNPEHSAAIRTSYENDLKAVYNAAVAASTPSQPVDGLDRDDVQGMIDSAVSANSFAIDSVMAEMDEVKGGVAMAIATASMPQAIDADTTVISAGLGHFGGQNAVSVGMSHRYESVTVNGSVSTDTETFSVGAGVGYSW